MTGPPYRVFVCSPYRGDVETNVAYAKAAMVDSLLQGEAPFVPHLLYTQVLDDESEADRTVGVQAGLAWLPLVEVLAVYEDLGISEGMRAEIAAAEAMDFGPLVVYRALGGVWAKGIF